MAATFLLSWNTKEMAPFRIHVWVCCLSFSEIKTKPLNTTGKLVLDLKADKFCYVAGLNIIL